MTKAPYIDDPRFVGPVSSQWRTRGVFLSQAWLDDTLTHHAVTAREARDRFIAVRGGETPEVFEISHRVDPERRVAQLAALLDGAARSAWHDFSAAREIAKVDILSQLRVFGSLRAFGVTDLLKPRQVWIPYPTWMLGINDVEVEKNRASGPVGTFWLVQVIKPVVAAPMPVMRRAANVEAAIRKDLDAGEITLTGRPRTSEAEIVRRYSHFASRSTVHRVLAKIRGDQ